MGKETSQLISLADISKADRDKYLLLWNKVSIDHADKKWKTKGKDVQFYVSGKTLFFECTYGLWDWLHNFNATVEPYKNMEVKFDVHAGFNELWKSVRDDIAKLKFENICGYSEGAVLACMAHEDFLFLKGYQPNTVTFGCPRFLHKPSDAVLARFDKIVNIQTPTDMVRSVPFQWMGYEHTSGPKIILDNGKITRPDYYSWYKWASGHSQSEYTSRLIRLATESVDL